MLEPDPKPFWKWYPGKLPSKQTANSIKYENYVKIKGKNVRNQFVHGRCKIGSFTGAFILGIVEQGKVDQIGGDGVIVIERLVDQRVGYEGAEKEEEGESDSSNRPVLPGTLPPPSDRAEPRVRHWLSEAR